MTFKNFDVDYDKVTIDDIIVSRPSYLSIMQWLNFWEFASHIEGGSLESMIKEAEGIAFKEGESNSETEHEKELEDQQKEFERNISRAVRLIETEAHFHRINNDEFLKNVEEILLKAIPEV